MPDTALPASSAGNSGASDSGATEQAQEKAKEVAGQAQEKAREAGQQVRGRVGEQVDQRSTQAGEQIAGTAGDVRSFADQLREQGKDKPAQYAEQAADRAERIGGYLKDADGDRILRDVEDYGRRNPWAVVAGGLALGFVASRMLKASSGERYRSSGQQTQQSQPNGTAAIEPPEATGTRPSQFEAHR
jgi:ElaB/YqjD/DUF883 family membrane-anchored ribosome-binding protein